MIHKGEKQKKKPSGGNPFRRRFLSFDSDKHDSPDSGSGSEKVTVAGPELDRHIRDPSNTSSLRSVEENSESDPFSDANWTEKAAVESPLNSPRSEAIRSPKSSVSTLDLRRQADSQVSRLQSLRPADINTGAEQPAADSHEPTPSPSRHRWNTVRQQLLPSSAGPSNSPSVHPQPSLSSLGHLPPYASPKPSRFARIAGGWGHTVEHVRQIVLDDARKFEEELKRACWSARFVEAVKTSKPERDVGQAHAIPALYKPFMSTNSLPFSVNSSASSLPLNPPNKYGMRRPQSVQSLASVASAPSTNELRSVLIRYAPPEGTSFQPLPLEKDVLSSLLVPFLSPDTTQKMDQERLHAIDAFEIAVKSWPAASNEFELGRCLWCCKAASMPPSRLRVRIFSVLDRLLSGGEPFQPSTPVMLQTLVNALFSLLPLYASQSMSSPEIKMLKDVLSRVQTGEYCRLPIQSTEEEYGAISVKGEDMEKVREGVILEALGRCLENGSELNRRWILWNATEIYWSIPSASPAVSPLLTRIYARKINIFINSALVLLSLDYVDLATRRVDAEVLVRILQSRVVPEVENMTTEHAREPRRVVVGLILVLLSVDSSRKQAKEYLCEWYHRGPEWKLSLENAVKHLITECNWSATVKILKELIRMLPDDVRKWIVGLSLPLLYESLVTEPPPNPFPEFTQLLHTISQMYPQLFFKPVILCAASSKEITVIKQLRIIKAVSKFLSDFLTRDAEMMSIALLSDLGSGSKSDGTAQIKAAGRLGQIVLLLELISCIHKSSRIKDDHSAIDPSLSLLPKFALALDSRLGVLLEAKEPSLSPFHRMLLCILFLEMRLFVRILKSATWLPHIVSWTLNMPEVTDALTSYDDPVGVSVNGEIKEAKKLLLTLREGLESRPQINHKRKSTSLSTSLDAIAVPVASSDGYNDRVGAVAETGEWDYALSYNLPSALLKLLVAMSGLLKTEDFLRLGPVLWHWCLDQVASEVIAPTCFLVMQCAEKTPVEFLKLVQEDVKSSDSVSRGRAVLRLGKLTSWRFQILSQDSIPDLNHRRPFKLTRPPLLFIPTDMGSSLFIHAEDPSEYTDSNGNVLPQELRKRLAEIGWSQDENPANPKILWKKTPMSLLPNRHIERMNTVSEMLHTPPSSPNLTPESSPKKSPSSEGEEALSRRGSSSRGVKRRAVFVHPLVALFPDLALLTFDNNIAVASAARAFIIDLMRDDPALLCRPVFDALAGSEGGLMEAIRTLRAFSHVRRSLPPALTHHVFNHLAGFLKFCSRLPEEAKPLMGFAYALPILSKLVSQVSEMSIREIRRAKVEIFLIPSGSLWFPSSAPDGPMFPRRLGDIHNPFEELPSHLVWVTMIRISQNMFFLDMLKRNPQDVQIIRKKLSRFVLPSRDNNAEQRNLELADFIPRRVDARRFFHLAFNLNAALVGLSLILSRSYLLLVTQVFHSMSRHLNDRNELSTYLDGLNHIMLAHGDDIGIVGQAMIALMTATTRFQRLFQSGSGYTLFMPTVIKVYTESESHSGIRGCIEYAVNRFFALHGYAFIFQSMSIMAYMITLPDIDDHWIAKGVYSLFSTLKNGIAPTTPDAAGIHNMNRRQEREALIVNTAEERPQAFLASLRRTKGPAGDSFVINLPDEYEGKRFGLHEFALFFINFIAEQDATLLRAEQFLRFLRLLTPHLYHGSKNARTALRDGIEHIGTILLTRAPGKAKVPEATLLQPLDSGSIEVYSYEAQLENQVLSKSTSPSDLFAMRADYLSLIVAFTKAGGQLKSAASTRIMELVTIIMKDSARANTDRIAAFLTDYTRSTLLREPLPNVKQVVSFLKDLLPFISQYASAIKLSGVLEIVCELAASTAFANEIEFGRILKEYCTVGLQVCALAASKDSVFEVSMRPNLILLLGRGVSIVGLDVIAEVAKYKASPGFLAGVILPLALTLKTSTEIASDGQWTDGWRRDVHGRTWMRLLSYTLSVCDGTHKPTEMHRSSSFHNPERPKLQDKGNRESDTDQASVLTIAIQTLKVIITRAENDLSASLPGVWARIAATIRSLLAEGDAIFAVDVAYGFPSSSPIHSPLTSTFLSSPVSEKTRFSSASTGLQRQSRLVPRPRLVDYLLWSFISWICRHRGPLLLQFRLLMQEKVYALDAVLRSQQNNSSVGGMGETDRRRSSVFVKPRRRVSSYMQSNTPSPEGSPKIGPSLSLPVDLIHTPNKATEYTARQPGYSLAHSPSTEGRGASGLKIVHLGPVRRSFAANLDSSVSRNGTTKGSLAGSAIVKLPSLVKQTYHRIRHVQKYMGYNLLLPLPDGSKEDPEHVEKAWTKTEILRALGQESKELLEDFRMRRSETAEDVVAAGPEEASPV